jgi:pSer/pThr/pTyr-binding forkhead associated (FHA) protein
VPVSLSEVSVPETVLPGHQNGYVKHSSVRTNSERRGRNVYAPIKAQVRIELDGKTTGTFSLDKPVLAIGRFPASDIPIASPRVSRFHALIHWRNNAWIIEDAESLNGLSFEGERIDQMGLVNGDRIHIDPRIVLHYEELS